MVVRLAVMEGPHRGQEFVFPEHDIFLVGRSRSAHFRLRDDYFSRLHFLVEVNPPSCRLTDLGSHNGTYVNGKKVDVADLKDGDLIQGGTTVLRLSVEAPGEMPATARYRTLSLPSFDTPAHPRQPTFNASEATAPPVIAQKLRLFIASIALTAEYHACSVNTLASIPTQSYWAA